MIVRDYVGPWAKSNAFFAFFCEIQCWLNFELLASPIFTQRFFFLIKRFGGLAIQVSSSFTI